MDANPYATIRKVAAAARMLWIGWSVIRLWLALLAQAAD